MELEGLVIEKTEVAYLKSFPYIVVKKTFQITCGVASFQIQKMKLILFCRLPASSRRQQISIILQFAPHIDVRQSCGSNSRCRVPKEVSSHCNGKVKSIPKADRGLANVYHRQYSGCLENSYSLAPVSRLLTTVRKITRPVRPKYRLGIGQQATKNPDRGGVFYINV